MNRTELYILQLGWLLIQMMAGYGAAKLFGVHAWIYVVFLVMYLKLIFSIGQRAGDKDSR